MRAELKMAIKSQSIGILSTYFFFSQNFTFTREKTFKIP